jgi:hypothetical protein
MTILTVRQLSLMDEKDQTLYDAKSGPHQEQDGPSN